MFEEPIPIEPFPGPIGGYGPTTTVVEVDLSNPDDLRIAGSLTLDGNYISARSIGDTARIVVTTPPTQLGFLYPSSPNAEESAAEANRRLVRETTVDDWVPGFSLTAADGSQTEWRPRRLREHPCARRVRRLRHALGGDAADGRVVERPGRHHVGHGDR